MHLYILTPSDTLRRSYEFEDLNDQERICNDSFFYALYKAHFQEEDIENKLQSVEILL